MKKLSMLLMVLLAMTMQSHRVFAQSVTITLIPGYNWISNPSTDTLDFSTALGSFTPLTGDIIQSQWGNAVYRNGQWYGGISQFYPGYGYMYYSKRTVPVTVTFNVQQPAPQVIVTTTEPTDITTNSATCGGNVNSGDGNYVFVILKGICWSTNPNPTFNDNYVESGNGIGSFTALMTELAAGTTYYVRAFAVTSTGTFYGEEINFTTLDGSSNIPTGAINGLFSVSATQQVWFSRGNLQYRASTNTWRFAESQYDCIGNANCNISSTYSGWIDLFGWGTSGYNHGAVCYQPWSTSPTQSDYYAYGQSSYNLFDQTGKADWGYNPISNGGNLPNQWRTLTRDEWNYIFNIRTTSSGIRYAKAQVNNVNGLVLLPDDWEVNYYILNNTNQKDASFSSNIISATVWSMIEQHGAIFLPAAGDRWGTSVYETGSRGWYWSASSGDPYDYVYIAYFNDSSLSPQNNSCVIHERQVGDSVRLVRNAE